MIQCIYLTSRAGRIRLKRWYDPKLSSKDKRRFIKEVNNLVLSRDDKLCNFVDYRDLRVVYKRYASLYFVCITDYEDNELSTLETIHFFVELLDNYFGNVCELDIIYNVKSVSIKNKKAYNVLDEFILNGEVYETNKSLIIGTLLNMDSIDFENERSTKKMGLIQRKILSRKLNKIGKSLDDEN
ncbi:hypothetical protein MHBO_002243 [Bonamia ostreae]|uniref:AP complex subunit sigma n=1 Tax=Bonamia ostreae TaxID=126728 RepID=A0ABV2AMQ3_9EUKA